MKTILLTAATALAVCLTAPAQATINAPVPADSYIHFGGLDWAWASPCAGFSENSCSGIDLSYQATQGWRIPTYAEFAARPTEDDFAGTCASAWFDIYYTHCDYGDPAEGYLFDFGYGVTPYGAEGYSDTWLVREAGGVPEAATWAMMIAGFGLVGAAARRRSAVAGIAA